MPKRVTFNETVAHGDTWSIEDYDRSQINSIVYERGYNRVSNIDWKRIIEQVRSFRLREMSIHIDNIDTFSL